jgi:hypothetical protein
LRISRRMVMGKNKGGRVLADRHCWQLTSPLSGFR